MTPERWQHIDKLLGEALEFEASRRTVFLDQACGGDEELRRKVDALLAAHEQADSFEVPAFTVAAQILADESRSMVGRQLAHYHVLALVGTGGMGAVWKAKDTRLDREVAIKTLPPGLDRRADRLARFEREAKVLASLNHPNIAAIHGSDEDRGERFLVLELVEGDTLADRLHHGAIPLQESLKLARQIAEGLEAAHEKGIIHRDLKPTNIKITNDGTVKVLDFGLAKVFADVVNADASDPPAQAESTEYGIILGTVPYMAPEQARGQKVDKRADIWAFGVVLYEMVTGTRLFKGANLGEMMSAVMMNEPDLDEVPPLIRRLLRKCLEKDPKNRLRDIGDAWELLNDPSVVEATHRQGGRRNAALPFLMVSVLAIIAIAFSFLRLKPLPLPEVARFQIHAPPGGRLPLGTPAISNDGHTLAYTVVDPDGVTRIYVRAIDGVESKVIAGTQGAVHPFWSPDGASIAYGGGSRLKRVDLPTGYPMYLMYGSNAWQGAWNQRGDILVQEGVELFRFPAQGGALTPIPNSSGASFPAFLFDGWRFLVRVNTATGSSIQLGALGSAERTLVVGNIDSAPVLASTPRSKTYLLFQRESDLMAQRFDEASGKVIGNPIPLVPHIGRVGNPAVMPTVGVSPKGILAYQNAGQVTTTQLKIVDRSGVPLQTLAPDVSPERPRLSPDQLSVAGDRLGNIWVTDLARKSSERKTFEDISGTSAVWSKDGSRIAFLRPQRGIYTIDVKGSGKPELLIETQGLPTSWSGKHLLYSFERKLYLVDLGGDKKPIQITPDGISSTRGEFSPDGKYVAYNSDRSGRKSPDGGVFNDVYVQPLPPRTGETRVSINAGRMPRWRADGKEIFFVSFEGDLMAADIKLGDPVSVGIPRKLFHFDSRSSQEVVANGYDVTRDGQRFLIVSPVEEPNSPITVVLNWWVELEKRLGK